MSTTISRLAIQILGSTKSLPRHQLPTSTRNSKRKKSSAKLTSSGRWIKRRPTTRVLWKRLPVRRSDKRSKTKNFAALTWECHWTQISWRRQLIPWVSLRRAVLTALRNFLLLHKRRIHTGRWIHNLASRLQLMYTKKQIYHLISLNRAADLVLKKLLWTWPCQKDLRVLKILWKRMEARNLRSKIFKM